MRAQQRIVAVLAIVVVSATLAYGQTKGKVEEALRTADAAWLKVYAAKDVAKSVAFFDEEGSMLPANAPEATGKKEITEALTNAFAVPGYTLTWAPNRVGAARSGDLGFTSGTYEFSMKDASGKTIFDKGKYLTAWKRQADGTWKVLIDIYNSDLPPAPAAPPA